MKLAIMTGLCLVTVASITLVAHGGQEIDHDLLSLQDCPDLPGCPAMVLLDETELNNESNRSRYSTRRLIKVFTDEGITRYADVEVSAMVGGWEVKNLTGRTILPDGTIIPLRQENVFVKSLRHGKRYEQVKTAKFPGVVKGAIIDYSFDTLLPPYTYLTQITWPLQDRLPVLSSKFTLKPGKLQYSWKQAGTETVPISEASPFKNVRYFTASKVPPLPAEPLSPPDDAMRTRLYFDLPELQAAWLGLLSGRMAGRTGSFIDDAPGIPEKTRELVAPTEAPIEKMKKIYRFVQEKIGTEEGRAGEKEQAKVKDAGNVGEVLARGFGDEYERTLLFIALARQAGFDAGLLLIVGRENSLFNDQVPDEDQFDTFAAAVNVGGTWNPYDPATKHCPFGMVSAEKEGGVYNAIQITPRKGADLKKSGKIQNLQLETNETAPYRILSIPFTSATRNVLTREAHVQLMPDGSAVVDGSEKGTGQADLDHRRAYEDLEEEPRRAALLENLHDRFPRADLLASSFENIISFDTPASITYRLKVPGVATGVGDRLLIVPSIYEASRPNPFTAEKRRTPVNFRYARKTTDRVVIQVPDGLRADDLPAPTIIKDPPLSFAMTFSLDASTVVMNRRLDIDTASWAVDQYPRLKTFFEKVQEADKQAIVLSKASQ